MIVKLLQKVKDAEIGSIIDTTEELAKFLIESKDAIEYTEEVKSIEKAESIKKAIKVSEPIVNKTINVRKNMSDEKFVVGKAFQMLTQKAVTGMSEGTAADGGTLVGTAVSEVMGLAMQGSILLPKCRKIQLPDKMNSVKIPIDASDTWIKANAPVGTNPAEGGDKTAAKLAFGTVTLTLGKSVLYIPVTDELLQDVEMLDGYIRDYARSKMGGIINGQIMVADGGGFDAVVDSAFTGTTAAITTLATAQAYLTKIDPRLNPEWFMGPANWSAIVNIFGTAANLNNQLIDIAGKKLLGKTVNVMPQLSEVVCADMNQYVVAEPRNPEIMSISEHVRFYNDETVFRLVYRGAGTPAWTLRTAADATVIGAFVALT